MLRNEAFDVSGGEVRKARRVDGRPSGAIRVIDGWPLVALAVGDGGQPAGALRPDAQENVDETMDFTVSLDGRRCGP